ncbi:MULTISPECIES: flavin reductase family protein [Streptomyces]|uniref:NADH-FMN oxidoreductase RutF, flavin reductase (DIM6/NTAB) family n=2 Tax=Streptomyces TaxID=1883 RepID=A0A9X8N9F3_9ACTN|nr:MULTISPECIES: flavin reductase family protein [Streptomyces]SHN33124.1 NADH-FMN oxidoreductase RutF, flavin reductase (DIM6/NTAB) family [Streptomyces yunnanensis]
MSTLDLATTPADATATTREATGPDRFRALMSGFPSGVAIITAVDEDHRPWGMTCSALCSVTVDPPTLLVGMRSQSPTLAAALHTGTFAVNLLHAKGQETAELFASGDPDRFAVTAWDTPAGGAGPHLTEAARAVADCRITETVRVGGQRMVFGEVYGIRELADTEPLLYGLRSYRAWPSPA